MPRQKGAARRKEREVLGAIKAQHRARLEKDIYGPKAKAPPPKITEATRARFGMLVGMVAVYTCATFANGLFAGVLLSGGMQGSPVVREYLSRWGWGLLFDYPPTGVLDYCYAARGWFYRSESDADGVRVDIPYVARFGLVLGMIIDVLCTVLAITIEMECLHLDWGVPLSAAWFAFQFELPIVSTVLRVAIFKAVCNLVLHEDVPKPIKLCAMVIESVCYAETFCTGIPGTVRLLLDQPWKTTVAWAAICYIPGYIFAVISGAKLRTAAAILEDPELIPGNNGSRKLLTWAALWVSPTVCLTTHFLMSSVVGVDIKWLSTEVGAYKWWDKMVGYSAGNILPPAVIGVQVFYLLTFFHYAAVYTSWWLWASAGLLSLVDPRLGQLAHFAGRVGELAPARSGVQRFYDCINPGHKYEDRHGLQHERLKDAEEDPDARQDCDIWDCTQARRARVKYWSQYSRKITERRERSKARRACAYCDARGTIMAPTFSVCARCRGPRYCSRLCQRAHWIDGHKDVCVRVRE